MIPKIADLSAKMPGLIVPCALQVAGCGVLVAACTPTHGSHQDAGMSLIANPFEEFSATQSTLGEPSIAEFSSREFLPQDDLLVCELPSAGYLGAESSAGGADSFVRHGIEPEHVNEFPLLDHQADLGVVEVTARWQWPEASFRRSPGRNSCGAVRNPPLEVELMGGLKYTAVFSDVGESPGSALISVSNCRMTPRVVVVGPGENLIMESLQESAYTVVVEEMSADGRAQRVLGYLPMRLPGHRVAIDVGSATLLRLHGTQDPDDFAYVVVSQGAAAVTDSGGVAKLALPAGERTMRLWHPPFVGQEAEAEARGVVNVQISPQNITSHVIDLPR